LSFDVDAIDPTYAAAVGTQEADGLTSGQTLEILRAVGIQNEIVAVDILEYNPFMDDAHQTTGILVDRMIRSLLSGIAGRKQGITDPLFLDPRILDHQSSLMSR
jgi:agmatinase